MKLNNVIFQHIRFRLYQWRQNGLLISEVDAISNAVAVADWHLNLIHTKREGHIMIPPEEYVKALRQRGIDVKVLNETEYSFTIEGLLWVLFPSSFFCATETCYGIGFPASRCVVTTLCMEPDEYADYLLEFKTLIPEIKEKALEIARSINLETREVFGDSAEERVISKENRHPVIDRWVIESNFTWGSNGERLLVGISDRPLFIDPSKQYSDE